MSARQNLQPASLSKSCGAARACLHYACDSRLSHTGSLLPFSDPRDANEINVAMLRINAIFRKKLLTAGYVAAFLAGPPSIANPNGRPPRAKALNQNLPRL